MINASLVSAQNRKRLFWLGQIRERLYFNDILCDNCLYEENKGVSRKTQDKRAEEILGETPERHCNMQNLSKGIQEDRQERNNKDLLHSLPKDKQEEQRQDEGFKQKSRISKKISEEEQTETSRISEKISSVGCREGEDEVCRQTAKEISNQKDEVSLSARIDRNKKENDEGGSIGDSKYETDMCCVQCHKRLNDRPLRSFISGWNEQPRKSPSIMSEMQFNEAQQNNGRVFDIYQLAVTLPEDRGILLKDILEPKVDEGFFVKEKSNTVRSSGRGSGIDDKHNWDTIRIGQFGKGGQGDRIYSPDGKSVALSANGGGRGAKTGLYKIEPVALRNRGEGKKPEYNGSGRANSLTTVQTDSMVEENSIIRKLTPIECERLQSLPDNYTEGVSNTQRYRALGNAFNVDVITHILKNMGFV
jgi:site-specific DNA-cytosine methylase